MLGQQQSYLLFTLHKLINEKETVTKNPLGDRPLETPDRL